MNGDDVIDFFDVDPFLLALLSPTQYALDFPNLDPLVRGDANGDGTFDFFDSDLFVALLVSGARELALVWVWIEAVPDSIDGDVILTISADANLDDGDGAFHETDEIHIRTRLTLDCDTSYTRNAVERGGNCEAAEALFSGFHDCERLGRWSVDPPHTEFNRLCPLNIYLQTGFGPGDYPPITNDATLSTAPLVSSEVAHFRGVTPTAERRLLEGRVDLLSGKPLLQYTDFELGFGGATFRHIRTYSEPLVQQYSCGEVDGQGIESLYKHESGQYWDWNGQFWMMGENPILLVDAAYGYTAGLPKRCVFIPDAHHAIPFIWQESTGAYVAPPWFDAVLTYEPAGPGQPGPAGFAVWLHRRSVKYTFEPVYERMAGYGDGLHPHDLLPDVDPEDGLPFEVFDHGVPYWARLTQVSDRFGNRAVMHYCTAPQTTCPESLQDPNTPCVECCRNCNEIGQLRMVELITAEDEVAWRLLYTHREFGSTSEILLPDATSRQPHMLHSIHVYRGDAGAALPTDCLTLPWDQFCAATTYEEADAIVHPAVPDGWVKSVVYTYGESSRTEFLERCQPTVDPELRRPTLPPLRLHRVTRIEKSFDAALNQETVHRSYQIYRYGNGAPPTMGNWYGELATLEAVYDASQVDILLKSAWHGGVPVTLDDLLMLPVECEITLNPGGPDERTAALGDLASFELGYPGVLDGADEVAVTNFVGAIDDHPDRTHQVGEMSVRLTVPDAGNGAPRVFRLWHFVSNPMTVSDDELAQVYFDSGSYLYSSTTHFPYRIPVQRPFAGLFFVNNDLDHPFHIAVIDECGGGDGATACDCAAYDAGDLTGFCSRRVVEMNAAGFVLRDRTWKISDGDAEQTDQTGYGEVRRYDCFGRLTELRSSGWGSAPNRQSQATDGLVTVYAYEPDVCDEDCASTPESSACLCAADIDNDGVSECEQLGALRAIGVRKGAVESGNILDGAVYVVRYERGIAGRPDLVTGEYHFSEPVSMTNPSATAPIYTETFYQFGGDPGEAIEFRPIVSKTVASAAAPVGDVLPGLLRSVQHERFDTRGNRTWVGRGSVAQITNTSTGAFDPLSAFQYFGVRSEFDELGRMTSRVEDPPASQYPADLPRVWNNEPALQTPLQYTTTLEYDDAFGLSRVTAPDGRETHIVHVSDGSGGLLRWEYPNLTPRGQIYVADPHSPLTVTRMQGANVVYTHQVRSSVFDGTPDGAESYDPSPSSADIISAAEPSYDESGRLAGVRRSGSGVSVEGAVEYDGFGNIARLRTPDGTITRNVYDERGRPWKTYRGTADKHDVWGNADPGYPDQFDDNMTLIEKRRYGEGVTDAGRLIEVRNYGERPNNQYNLVDGNGEPIGGPNNEDEIGWTTKYAYDWRMREVRVSQYASDTPPSELDPDGEDGAALRHTLVWYDNLDRVVLTAEYAGSLPGGVDPADPTLGPTSTPPPAGVILAATPKPIALSETLYNNRNQVAEQRAYNVEDGSYTASFTFYDHENHVIETRAANSPISQTIYDARGRMIVSRTVAAGAEVTRTESFYNTDNQAIRTTHWERKHDAGASGSLTEANSVRTYVHTWYDSGGRVSATLNYGTNAATYTTGVDPVAGYSPAGPPDPVPAGALLTRYDYDDAGRQSAVHHPDGTTTAYEYDGLGRMLLMTENASDRDGDGTARRTAYKYHATTGQLIAIAAVLATPFGGYASIDWNPAGPNQVTTLEYDPAIYPRTWQMAGSGDWSPGWGAAFTGDKSLVSRVTYPDGDTLEMAYYTGGLVAYRKDARGNEFFHRYDELGRRVETWIDDTAYYAGGWLPAELVPPLRVQHVLLGYTPDGLLADVTAHSYVSGVEQVVASNHFDYNALRQLERETQDHFGAAPPAARSIEYEWEFSPNTPPGGPGPVGYNFTRLREIRYPGRKDGLEPRRPIQYFYGNNTDDIDSVHSRVTQIFDNLLHAPLATYEYAGSSRRVSVELGNGVAQTFAGGEGYSGLDRFGRTADLHFRSAAGATVHRYEYAYDAAGNRLHARVTQAAVRDPSPPHDLTPHGNDRSYLYDYDALNQLTDAHLGRLDSENATIVPHAEVALDRALAWQLDILGNWTGSPAAAPVVPGLARVDDLNGDGLPDDESHVSHAVDLANQIAGVATDPDGSGPAAADELEFIYDRAGNLIFDGRLVYFYDGFNRLVQVNLACTTATTPACLEAPDFDIHGKLAGTPQPQPAALVARFAYDGLGRLIRRETPLAVGAPTAFEPYVQTAEFYYDGVRRIQEVLRRAGSAVEALVTAQWLPVEALTWPQLEEREFVYGPEYVDEFVAVYDSTFEAGGPGGGAFDLPVFVLQDANYNVVALLSPDADPGDGVAVAPDGLVLAQFVWEPYGALAAVDRAQIAPGVCVGPVYTFGHQGLFFERFATEPGAHAGSTTLTPGATGLYYNRNRWYSPQLGRFLTRDPNETAMPLISAAASRAQAMNGFLAAFGAAGHYADGMSLYGYARSSPARLTDSLGLTSYAETSVVAYGQAELFSALVPVVGAAQAFAIRVATSLAVRAFQTSVAIIGAAASASGVDPGYYQALSDELSRFTEWANSRSRQVFHEFQNRLNQAANGNFNPNNDDELWKRFHHTIGHAKQYFGTQAPLTSQQLSEWASLIHRTSASSINFAWQIGPNRIPTTAYLMRLPDGRYFVTQYFANGNLASAWVMQPGRAQTEAMLRAAGMIR